MTILIADDERTIRQGLVASVGWEALGIDTVLEAADGREALRMIEEHGPDIAVLDIKMPEMTGIELVGAYRENPCAPRFILLSGYSEFDYAREALRSNVVDYLLKPCSVEEISRVIGSVVEAITRSQQKRSAFLLSLETMDAADRLWMIRTYLTTGAFPSPEELNCFRQMPAYSPPVRQAMKYMAENLADPDLSLNFIAREVLYLNPDYFGKLFKKEVGEKFSAMLMSMRMDEAMRLLARPDEELKVYEVAARVGLGGNTTYFGRTFKKISGMLPTQYAAYRKKQKQEKRFES